MKSVVDGSFEPESSSEALDGISRAFFDTLDRRASVLELVVLALACLFVIVALVRRRREREREEAEEAPRREALEVAHAAAMAALANRPERRTWLRAHAHVPVRVFHVGPRDALRIEELETQDFGGDGLSFLARRPPAPGTALELALVLDGEGIRLHGVVVRVEPGPTPEAPSLVALAFGDVGNAARERVVHAVLEEERRALVRAREGKTCTACHRPLASDTEDTHVTCRANPERFAAENAPRVAVPASTAPKRRAA